MYLLNLIVFFLFYGLVLLVPAIIYIVDLIRFRHEVVDYIKYGLLLAGFLTFIEIIVLTINGPLIGLEGVVSSFSMFISFIKHSAIVCIGVYYCSKMGHIDLPIIRRIFKNSGDMPHMKWKTYTVSVILGIVVFTAFTNVLFNAVPSQVSPIFTVFEETSGQSSSLSTKDYILASIALFFLAASEEISFRMGIQSLVASKAKLQGKGYILAVIVSSILWTAGHYGAISPSWLKFVQIFPMGVALGYLFKKFGLESCILVHGIFNIVTVLTGLGSSVG